jgi:hypothetical protein
MRTVNVPRSIGLLPELQVCEHRITSPLARHLQIELLACQAVADLLQPREGLLRRLISNDI